jgi:Na+/melibiose symporter-like transporter
MVFGTNALITKPANSLSPMLVVSILNRFGYGEVKKMTSGKMADIDGAGSEGLKMAMFALVCWYPVVMGVIQLFSWSFFRINKRTEIIVKADKIHQGV